MQKNLLLPRINTVREVKTNKEWDIKKLILVSLFLAGILAVFLFFKFYFFADSNKALKEVKGQESRSRVINTDNIQEAVKGQMDSIKEQAENINITDIATSSPQVQKIIKDIQALENYPSNQARSMCENLCKSL